MRKVVREREPNHRNRTGCLETISANGYEVVLSGEKLTSLSLESIDNIKGGDSLALGVLSVGDSITNNTLKECL